MPDSTGEELFKSLPATDLSNQVFSKLFGDNWFSLAESGGEYSGPLIDILQTLNVVMLTLVVAFSLKTLLQGGIGTASEGTVGGSKMHSFWWPFRAVAGIAMTTPMPWTAGLSFFQALLLVAVGWSCSLANAILYKTVDYMAESNFAVVTADAPMHMQHEAEKIAKVLYRAHFVQNYILNDLVQLKAQLEKEKGEAVEIEALSDFKEHGFFDRFKHVAGSDGGVLGPATSPKFDISFYVPKGMGLDPSDLGSISLPGENDDPMLSAKVDAISEMSWEINKVTQQVVRGEDPEKGWLQKATKTYEKYVMDILRNAAVEYPELDVTTRAKELKKSIKERGWMAAGAFPMIMTSTSNEMREDIFERASVAGPDFGEVSGALADVDYNRFANMATKAESKLDSEPNPSDIGSTIEDAMKNGDPDSMISSILESALHWGSGRGVLQLLLDNLKEKTPILAIPQLGHFILDAGITVWGAGAAIAAANGAKNKVEGAILGKVVSFVADIGTFGGKSALSGAMSGLAVYALDTIEKICDGLFIVGALFAYVFPAMPTLYWIVAMGGFMLLVVEVLIAAPFWGAAHAWSTQEEGFAGEMGKQGYFQLLEIIFRPALFVLGFVVIFLLMKIVGFLTAEIFEAFYFSYAKSDVSAVFSHTGLITSFFMALLLGGMFMYMFYYLCSEGYSHLPRKIMGWIGHQANSMGISNHAGAMRTMIVGGAATLGAHSGAHSGAQSGAETVDPKEKKDKDDNDPGAAQGSPMPGTGGAGGGHGYP
jgi:conjugal transfer/type IV secretion protein DotA/TraY